MKSLVKCTSQKALNKNQSETGGMAGTLNVKVNAKVILTVNINIDDRLIIGQMGTLCKIKTDNVGQVVITSSLMMKRQG